MTEVGFEDPWIKRQDGDYKRRGRGFNRCQGNRMSLFYP